MAELARDVPRLTLIEADNLVHDGGGLALRTPLLYRFVIDHYIPHWQQGFIVGHRREGDAPQSGAGVTLEAAIRPLTDENWQGGVHRHDAALVLDDAALFGVLRAGMPVDVAPGERRTIIRVWREGQAIWLDGDALPFSETGPLDRITVTLDASAERAYRLALFDEAFSTPDLGMIPVAWGRSERSLRRKMERVHALDALAPAGHDLIEEGGSYRVSGPDPYLTLDLSPLAVSGRDAGLLRLEFACLHKTAQPRIQVFWWGDGQAGPDEAVSLRFTAADGVLLVPLDAFPRWLALARVRALRLDLDQPGACGAIRIAGLGLYQRTAVQTQ